MADEAHNETQGAFPEWVFPGAPTTDSDPELAPGQIWRARWDDLAQLVFIDSLPDDTSRVRVTPVEIGDADADDDAVIVPAEETHLHQALSVWLTLTTDVAALTLDRWVATLRSFSSEEDLVEAANAGTLRRGVVIANDASPRLANKKALGYSACALHGAGHLRGGQGNLAELLKGVSTAELAQALEGDTPLAVSLKRGRAVLDVAMARRIELAMPLSSEELLNANPAPPVELLKAIWARERGASLREVARKRGESESEAFAQMSQGVFALAARGERRDEVDWAGRVDTYLHMALAE